MTCSAGEQCSGRRCVTLPPMPTARADLAATTGADGVIYALGGVYIDSGIEHVATVEAYDPATNAWRTLPDMPTARTALAAFVDKEGDVYAVGGTPSGLSGSALAVLEIYRAAQAHWEQGPPMHTNRYSPAYATGSDGRFYVFGGYNSDFIAKSEAFDPVARTWRAIAPLPVALSGHSAVTADDGRILVVGGWDGRYSNRKIFVYDPTTDAWDSLPHTLETSRTDFGAAMVDNRLYLVGGAGGPEVDTLGPVDVLDLGTGAWTSRAAIPLPRRGLAVTVGRAPHALIFAIGGEDSMFTNYYDTLQGFSPTSGAW